MKDEEIGEIVCVIYVMNLLFWISKYAKETSTRWRVGFGNVGLLMVYLNVLRSLFLFVAQVHIENCKKKQNTENINYFYV
jgi:hypothetical protein